RQVSIPTRRWSCDGGRRRSAPALERKGVYAMKPSKRSIGIVGVFAAGVLLSPLAAAQDSSAPSDNRAAQAWRDLQQKTQHNFRQGQQRMRDAMSHVQVTPPQTFRNDTG